jgi:membrane fusion protein, multidrug efflux system
MPPFACSSFHRLPVALFAVNALLLGALSAQNNNAVPVVVTEVQREIVTEKFSLTGTVTPLQQSMLSPRVTGLVETVHVDAGSVVRAGDRLLTLDATLAELAIESAAAARSEAQTRLAEAERLFAESERLQRRNSIPDTEVQNRKAAVAIAEAAARRADVAHQEQQERVKRHTVFAPFSGVITEKMTEAGEWVSTGDPVLQLVGLDTPKIDVRVPQERMAAIKPTTAVEFAVDGENRGSTAARIFTLVGATDPMTRTSLVRVEPADLSTVLPVGRSARVTFLIASDAPVLTVPRDAVVRRADGTVNVWIAESNGDAWTAATRRIELGRPFSNHIEVVAGLAPGQRVIIRGNETLRPNQAISVTTAAPDA